MEESLISSLCTLSTEESELNDLSLGYNSLYSDVGGGGDLDGNSEYSLRSDVFNDDSDPSDDDGQTNAGCTFYDISVDESFLQPLYDGAKLTVFESYTLILQYSLRHGLTKKAFGELLILIGKHIPMQSMSSLYKVRKFFLELYSDITFKQCYYCSICRSLLEGPRTSCPQLCDIPSMEFLSIQLASQLKRRLEGIIF